jgi:hypothetical protein
MDVIKKAFNLLENAKNKNEYIKAVNILKFYGAKKTINNNGDIIWELKAPITTKGQ